MNNETPAVVVKDLTKVYGRLTALDRLSLNSGGAGFSA